MRVGVSAKVFLAYAVLLVALGANSVFSVASLRSAGQHVEAHRGVLDVDSHVQGASRLLEQLDRLGEASSPRLAGTYIQQALDNLANGRGTLVAGQQTTPRPAEFEQYRDEIAKHEQSTRQVESALIASFQEGPSDLPNRFKDQLTRLRNDLDLFSNKLRKDSERVIKELTHKEDQAVRAAIILGLAGLLGALGAALSLWRTLRPLWELRLRARQLAGGDYGRRIGLRTRDEIGDLAREFDNMAQALEEREQKLIRSERLATVGRIAAQITHEIRNPLAAIGLNAELIADELGSTQSEARRQLAAITGEVDRLSEITESYLRFVRLPRLRQEREDLGALVTSAMEFARSELAQAGIDLVLEIAADLPEVAADENQLRQALLNLLRNAKEAMPAGGKLRVALDAGEPGRVSLSVTDTGAGIAPENVGRVFEPFFSTKAKGTGLGLALVQQIVHEHGGRIEVKSDATSGTTFLLSFPSLPARTAEPPAISEAEPASAGPAALAIPRRS